jgi:hypothetical protein
MRCKRTLIKEKLIEADRQTTHDFPMTMIQHFGAVGILFRNHAKSDLFRLMERKNF